jgi:hypothetical protein
MRKKAMLLGFALLAVAALSSNAFADGEATDSWTGMCNSVGGFFHNAMPWNWHEWAGK